MFHDSGKTYKGRMLYNEGNLHRYMHYFSVFFLYQQQDSSIKQRRYMCMNIQQTDHRYHNMFHKELMILAFSIKATHTQFSQ